MNPEIIPSTFEENIPLSQFEDLHEYPVATANFKAVEVYRELVVCVESYHMPKSLKIAPWSGKGSG